MYNEKQKIQYFENELNVSDDIKNRVIGAMFRAAESSEIKFNKDLCDFTLQEIIDFYTSLYTSSYNRLNNITSQFKAYTRWCRSEMLGNTNMNNYELMTKDLITSCLNVGLKDSMIYSKKDIYNIIDDDSSILNIRDKVIILGIFEGLYDNKFETLINASLSNLNGNTFVMNNGKQISISDKLRNIIIESANTYECYTMNGGQAMFKDVPNILKPRKNAKEETIKYGLIKSVLRYYKDILELNFTVTSIKDSGIINYAIEHFEGEDLHSKLLAGQNEITKIYGVFSPEILGYLYKDLTKE